VNELDFEALADLGKLFDIDTAHRDAEPQRRRGSSGAVEKRRTHAKTQRERSGVQFRGATRYFAVIVMTADLSTSACVAGPVTDDC
jgi:hypothetical protein